MENQVEIWKPVKGFEGYYEVSDLGRVKNSKTQRILKTTYSCAEYPMVKMYKNGLKRTKAVHVLVGESFLAYTTNGTSGLVLDHINNLKHDSRLKNLQIITHRENVRKGILKKDTIYYGVYRVGKKWRARCYFKNKPYHVGYYHCDYEAHLAVEQKIKELENGRNS